MGSKLDSIRRGRKRQDTTAVQGNITLARKWVFEKGYHVRSKMVDALLEPLSLLPTRVSSHLSCMAKANRDVVRVRFLQGWLRFR